jgi:hypothetical protein
MTALKVFMLAYLLGGWFCKFLIDEQKNKRWVVWHRGPWIAPRPKAYRFGSCVADMFATADGLAIPGPSTPMLHFAQGFHVSFYVHTLLFHVDQPIDVPPFWLVFCLLKMSQLLVHSHNTLSMKLVTLSASYAGALSLCLAVASATFTSEPDIGTCDPGIAEKEGYNCQGCPAGTETTHQSMFIISQ